MAVVIDDRYPTLTAAHMKAPLDAAEARQGFVDGVDGDLQLEPHRYRRGCVEHIMSARDAQTEAAQIAVAKPKMEFARHVADRGACDPQMGLRADAVRDDAPVHSGQNLLNVFVVQAQDRYAVKRNFLDEFAERLADLFD